MIIALPLALIMSVLGCSKSGYNTTSPTIPVESVTVSTLAGQAGIYGKSDGVGTAALFHCPHGVAVDTSGNVYVADSCNNIIRKIAPDQTVTTLAGSGFGGSANGVGAAASFNYPLGVAADSSGNVYVADNSNEMIRLITPGGAVTTLAHVPNWPSSVAVTPAGTVYESESTLVRVITSAGVTSVLAGAATLGSTDGIGTKASFYYPQGVAVDASGNVFVADTNNNRIRKITPDGIVTTLAGTGGSGSTNGVASTATFSNPQGVAVDGSNNIYVADTGNNLIRKVTSAGLVITLAGTGSSGFLDGPGLLAKFNQPTAIAVDGSGKIYVADNGNQVIRVIH
jgi:sugar lactone lactonase YvrE